MINIFSFILLHSNLEFHKLTSKNIILILMNSYMNISIIAARQIKIIGVHKFLEFCVHVVLKTDLKILITSI